MPAMVLASLVEQPYYGSRNRRTREVKLTVGDYQLIDEREFGQTPTSSSFRLILGLENAMRNNLDKYSLLRYTVGRI